MDESTYSNIPRLGWIVWNEVGPIFQTFAEAQAILQYNGFDPVLLPRTTPKKAFVLALGSVKEMRAFSRPVTENSEMLRYQTTIEAATDAKAIKAVVDFMKEDEKISFRVGWGGRDELKNAIMMAYQRFRDRVYHWNLGRFAVDDIDRCDGVAVRPKGGVWFVPDVHAARIQAMGKVFEGFANGCAFYKHPVIDTAQWRNNVARFAEEDMSQQLKELEAEFANFADAYGGKEVAISSLRVRLDAYRSVREKAEVYESLLSFRAEGIREKIRSMEKKMGLVAEGGTPMKVVEKKTRKRKVG